MSASVTVAAATVIGALTGPLASAGLGGGRCPARDRSARGHRAMGQPALSQRYRPGRRRSAAA